MSYVRNYKTDNTGPVTSCAAACTLSKQYEAALVCFRELHTRVTDKNETIIVIESAMVNTYKIARAHRLEFRPRGMM